MSSLLFFFNNMSKVNSKNENNLVPLKWRSSPRNNSHKLNINFRIQNTFLSCFFFYTHHQWEEKKGQDKTKYLLINYYVPGVFINLSLNSSQPSEKRYQSHFFKVENHKNIENVTIKWKKQITKPATGKARRGRNPNELYGRKIMSECESFKLPAILKYNS